LAAWRAWHSWQLFCERSRCDKAWVPLSVQMAAAAAEVHSLEMESRGRKRGRRGVSEPRLARFEKRELIERMHDTWARHAENYWIIAQSKCEAAKEWYEHMAHLYVQARDKESMLELGPGGHLLDHRYQVGRRAPRPLDAPAPAPAPATARCAGCLLMNMPACDSCD